MNRLDQTFKAKGSPKLAVYTVVGYPSLAITESVTKSLASNGADIIELGMPFSDPVADGPVIQKAHYDSLLQGTSLKEVFNVAASLKGGTSAVVLMGYINPVLAYGMVRFLTDAAAAGVDGVILPDMPPEEFERSYKAPFEANGIKPIFLVSPNTPEARIRYLDSLSKGFLYAVSSLSITGGSRNDDAERSAYLKRLSSYKLSNPIMVGFGISTKEDFDGVTAVVPGAIVGSAFVKMLESGKVSEEHVRSFVRQFR